MLVAGEQLVVDLLCSFEGALWTACAWTSSIRSADREVWREPFAHGAVISAVKDLDRLCYIVKMWFLIDYAQGGYAPYLFAKGHGGMLLGVS